VEIDERERGGLLEWMDRDGTKDKQRDVHVERGVGAASDFFTTLWTSGA
jgi:hypothetical protein